MKYRFLLIGLCLATSAFADEGALEREILTISGEGVTKVAARLADVSLSVQIDGRSASEVQRSMARLISPIVDALRSLKADRIEGGNPIIYPQYGKDNQTLVIGYRGQTTVSFTSSAEQAGALIDLAIQAGANRVESVTLRPDQEQLSAARQESLKAAASNALREAAVVLDALGLHKNAIVNVTVHPTHVPSPIRPMRYKQMALSVESEPIGTQILQEEQEVTASILLKIEYSRISSR